MKYRFYYSDWGEGVRRPHVWVFDIVEYQVQAVLLHPGEAFPGYDDVRIALGQIQPCDSYLRIIYIPEPDKDCVFVLAAWRLRGKELKACRARQRKRGRHHRLREPKTPLAIGGAEAKLASEPYPHGWDEERIQRVLAHYEGQRDSNAQIAEDEAAIGSLQP